MRDQTSTWISIGASVTRTAAPPGVLATGPGAAGAGAGALVKATRRALPSGWSYRSTTTCADAVCWGWAFATTSTSRSFRTREKASTPGAKGE